MTLLYVAGTLPSRSETFVYREVLALRTRGVEVVTVSVHAPETGLGEPVLDELAESTPSIYGRGVLAMLNRALRECVRKPARSAQTIASAIKYAISTEVAGIRRIKVLWQAIGALSVAEYARSCGVSHIHAHMAHVPTTMALFLARQLKVEFSFTGHAVDLFRESTLLPTKLWHAAFCACISHWHRAYYRELVPSLPDAKLPLVRCGVDTAQFKPADNQSEDGIVQIVSVGRLVRKKGFDLLLRALRASNLSAREVQLTVVGDGPERSNLERLAQELGLETQVTFAGAKSHAEVRSVVRRAGLFVLPCRIDTTGDKDGIPVALMEAMACSVPVVSGDLPAIRELIEAETTGILVEVNDVNELGLALRRLCTSAPLRRILGIMGRQKVEAEFSSDTNIERLMQAFAAFVSLHREKPGQLLSKRAA